MLLQELIDEDLIILELKASNKKEVIKEIAELFVKKGVATDKDKLVADINKREEMESTGIGNNIAIPHAKSDAVKEIKVAFGRIKEGINFKALDELIVYFIFMVVGPKDASDEYLQAVAKVLRFLRPAGTREALLEVKSPKEVMELIKKFDGMTPETIKVKTKQGRVIYKKR